MKKTIKLLSIVLAFLLAISVVSFAADGTATGKAGQTVEIEIEVDGNPGIAMARLKVSYDADALELKDVEDGGIWGKTVHSDNLTASPYTLFWSNPTVTENIVENGTLATLEFKIKNGEINLDLAAFKLEGEDLKQYKLSIYSRLEADYEHTKDLISVRENKLNEEKDALKKQYGFFARLFNKEYKGKMEKIKEGLAGVRNSYKTAKKEIQYRALKEFEDKDLSMTRKEMKALAAIVKDTPPALVRIWDSTRQTEKEAFERAGQAYEKYDYIRERENERLARLKERKQLDLGDKIHKPVEKTETVRETSVKEKEIEKEQKVQEGPDLEK